MFFSYMDAELRSLAFFFLSIGIRKNEDEVIKLRSSKKI